MGYVVLGHVNDRKSQGFSAAAYLGSFFHLLVHRPTGVFQVVAYVKPDFHWVSPSDFLIAICAEYLRERRLSPERECGAAAVADLGDMAAAGAAPSLPPAQRLLWPGAAVTEMDSAVKTQL